MSPYRRNVMVGVVVIGALVVLGWMILKFGGQPMALFTPARIPIHFLCERADGLSNGAIITYRGVSVGQIMTVNRGANDAPVVVDGIVDAVPPLPENLKGVIRSQGLVGGGSVMVLVTIDPQPKGELKADQQIVATYIGLDILPPEFAELAADLRLTSKQFRESNVVTHIDDQVQHIGQLVDSMQSLVGDPKMRKDLQDSMANLRETTATADKITQHLDKFTDDLDRMSKETSATINQANSSIQKTEGHVDDVSKSMEERLVEVSALLQQFQQIAQKVNAGQGTAGQLVNDPQLYQSLVATTQQLNATIADLKRLVEQWEQEGVSLKVAK
jgi:phospholipid/cholesterol/gamma-HCH transport system substrate-binding protein